MTSSTVAAQFGQQRYDVHLKVNRGIGAEFSDRDANYLLVIAGLDRDDRLTFGQAS